VIGWLLYKNGESELGKRQWDTQVGLWTEAQPQSSVFVSVVTIAEIHFGIDRTAKIDGVMTVDRLPR
jgi:predicted nucleic acid-binding protein